MRAKFKLKRTCNRWFPGFWDGVAARTHRRARTLYTYSSHPDYMRAPLCQSSLSSASLNDIAMCSRPNSDILIYRNCSASMNEVWFTARQTTPVNTWCRSDDVSAEFPSLEGHERAYISMIIAITQSEFCAFHYTESLCQRHLPNMLRGSSSAPCFILQPAKALQFFHTAQRASAVQAAAAKDLIW